MRLLLMCLWLFSKIYYRRKANIMNKLENKKKDFEGSLTKSNNAVSRNKMFKTFKSYLREFKKEYSHELNQRIFVNGLEEQL
ncbi:MAG: hypothetical protein ACRCZ2_02890, partial [Fusobacteriaceae bacterium]